MNSLLIQLLPAAIFLLPLCVPLGINVRIRHQRKHRRNPLTFQMLRAPGETINKSIEQLSEDIDQHLTFSGVVPLLCFSTYLTTRFIAKTNISPIFLIILALCYMTFSGIQLNKMLRQRHKEVLGLDCERAVGQELSQLMLDGYRIFHDFQADKFNIDHIVIGENGVFAIETKGRAKPDRGKGKEEARVTYDGQSLQFPSWSEQEPLEQAKRQAAWLSNWLSKAVGAPVAVKPVLALPGWYVERKKPDFIIFNGKNPQFLLKFKAESPLSSEMIQRVAHQIDQRCRNVAPQAYQKN